MSNTNSNGSRSDRACLQSGAAVLGNSKGTRPMLTGGSFGTSPVGSPIFSTGLVVYPDKNLLAVRGVIKEG